MDQIRLSKSVVAEEEKLALERVIDTGYLGMGTEVKLFEQEICEFLGTDYQVICVNSGTAALHLALQALGIGSGDEVLVPSFTYVATFQAISATGARPISCDVIARTGFVDIEDAESRITCKTKAIIPVHYASNNEGIEKVYALADKHGLRVVEDAAHSFGCKSKGSTVGKRGDIICFSFDGIKNITSGEGGAVVTGDKHVAQCVKDARLLGVEKDTEKRFERRRSWSFDVTAQGWRYHMSDVMAAIGREQLKKAELFFRRRREIAKTYSRALASCEQIDLLAIDYNEDIVPHIFPITVKNNRDQLQKYLQEQGIETGLHYSPCHKLSLYSRGEVLSNTEKLEKEILSLPIHPGLSNEDVGFVIAKLIFWDETNGLN